MLSGEKEFSGSSEKVLQRLPRDIGKDAEYSILSGTAL